jgi:hypothetical protein
MLPPGADKISVAAQRVVAGPLVERVVDLNQLRIAVRQPAIQLSLFAEL